MPEILTVCYGNLCRSPMAEVMLQRGLDRRLGDRNPFVVTSAGVGAQDGNLAPAPGRAAMARRGLDLSGHRSRRLTAAIARRADRIVCMSSEHREHVLALVPDAAAKTITLGADVPDPLGGGEEDYERVARFLEPLLEALADELAADIVPRAGRSRGGLRS